MGKSHRIQSPSAGGLREVDKFHDFITGGPSCRSWRFEASVTPNVYVCEGQIVELDEENIGRPNRHGVEHEITSGPRASNVSRDPSRAFGDFDIFLSFARDLIGPADVALRSLLGTDTTQGKEYRDIVNAKGRCGTGGRGARGGRYRK
jgi:hypothetical protein